MALRAAATVRLCDRAGCEEKGDCPAPKSPNSPDRWYFCESTRPNTTPAGTISKGWTRKRPNSEQSERATGEAYRQSAWSQWGGSGDGNAQPRRIAALEVLGWTGRRFRSGEEGLARQGQEVHPDVRPGDAEAAKAFHALQLSYEVRAAEGGGSGEGRVRFRRR
jgi:hypothetical protein